MDKDYLKKFSNLSYEAFKEMAKDDSLSRNEKIGFPDEYRKGKEKIILKDICDKIPSLEKSTDLKIADIGCGCGPLTDAFLKLCQKQKHHIILVDSSEMLDQIPQKNSLIEKIQGHFPDMPEFIKSNQNKIDCVLIYSVAHYIFHHQDIFKFLDEAVKLLCDGGSLLLGDIPNIDKKKRFFSSEAGITFHQQYTGDDSLPDINQMQSEPSIDDKIILEILKRYRLAGFETYVLSQDENLPMANRREDILIKKN